MEFFLNNSRNRKNSKLFVILNIKRRKILLIGSNIQRTIKFCIYIRLGIRLL